MGFVYIFITTLSLLLLLLLLLFELLSDQSFLCHSYPLNDAAETVNEIGVTIGRVMGGTSGIL